MAETQALVLFGDVVASSKDRIEATNWLRGLVDTLDTAYGDRRLAPFGFTQGDELQGLLAVDADPFLAVLHAALGPSRPIRWVCIWGQVDAPLEGPATQQTGDAFLAARKAIGEARAGHERLIVRTGESAADELLAGMAPALVDLLDGLTDRQRAVARMALLDGLRQSEVAGKLHVARATTSVAFRRAKVQSIGRLVDAMRVVCARGASGREEAADPGDGRSA
jgi:hypothetical protein